MSDGGWQPIETYDPEGDEVVFADGEGRVGGAFEEWGVWFWTWDKEEFVPVAWHALPPPPGR